MSNIFFVSDTHWGHANIIKYSNRPFTDVDEMDEKLIENWNKVVKRDDMVYHLGDFAFMKIEKFRQLIWRLNGNIGVIKGNHDQMITENEAELSKRFVFIKNYYELKAAGQFFVLFHYGQRVWHRSHKGSIHLYGHSHGSLPPHGKSVDVGVDCKEITSEYRPIYLGEVLDYMKDRTPAHVDYHGSKRLS